MDLIEAGEDPRHWYTTNLVGRPADELASVQFNARPQRLSIAATRATHRGLFDLLKRSDTLVEAREVFTHYMRVAYALDEQAELANRARRYRPSYLRLLQGWGFDSSGPEAAVLKGWVESRFGISPTFHSAPLGRFPSAAWIRYIEDKLHARFHNSCVSLQLDVLYEYCQWAIERFSPFAESQQTCDRVVLYRGMLPSEAGALARAKRHTHGVLRLNNLVSLTTSEQRADEFGPRVLRVPVPYVKLLVFPGLLATQALSGEQEVIAIGGDYEVDVVV